MLREAWATGRVLVVDETRRTRRRRGGGGRRRWSTPGYTGRLARVASKDSFIPLGDAALHVLLSEAEIEEAALRLVDQPTG